MRNQLRSFFFFVILLASMTSLLLIANLSSTTADEDTPSIQPQDFREHQVSLAHKSNEWEEAEELEELEDGEEVQTTEVSQQEESKSNENNQESEEEETVKDESPKEEEEVVDSEEDVENVEQASMSAEVAFKQFPAKTVVATGYTAGYESTGKTKEHPQYGITYSGLTVQRDVISTVAADPNVFPLGTVLYVPDYGYGIVMDTGGAIKGNKIDLYYETVDEVYNEWGKKSTDVYVIEMGDGSVTEDDLVYWEEQVQSEALPVFNDE
ncbi:3D domain-containing protein [Piscibacillus halophilus]|uniref:3D (Asp-Asp-Asp) domain-containing protein n=1 Tax=Piscibacillus halophilus TaxID=571933 RepID=A0A1H9JKH9_9BACI|nr:3D domain-containing protein [Piscibacillus halophilus]SEQ87392.1 3D (Asp-Asp-Asp) domain-containing protein [Piscibacillus halophilus]